MLSWLQYQQCAKRPSISGIPLCSSLRGGAKGGGAFLGFKHPSNFRHTCNAPMPVHYSGVFGSAPTPHTSSRFRLPVRHPVSRGGRAIGDHGNAAQVSISQCLASRKSCQGNHSDKTTTCHKRPLNPGQTDTISSQMNLDEATTW